IGLCNVMPQRFLYFIALRVADLNYYWLDKKGRKAVHENLRQVLTDAPEARIHKEARWVFRNFAKYLTEFFRFRHFDETFFRTNMAHFGVDNVDNALAGGKGCIISSAHMANWELGAAGLSIMGHKKMTVSVAMHRFGKINNLFMREREAVGLTVADMPTAPPRSPMRAPRRNEGVGAKGLRDPTAQGVMVDFFGKPCRFPQGPARMSLATGAPIIPAFCLRRTNDSFTTVFLPPLAMPVEGDREEKVRAITQQFAQVMENAIQMFPEQWAVFYSFWAADWQPE
ncbi:MAG: lysophospholipid acyltransferase family protein, partial [Parabacteroides sp.]|nr:lysophospholipid acyltransferase family protein [Parabacteroides sp.]